MTAFFFFIFLGVGAVALIYWVWAIREQRRQAEWESGVGVPMIEPPRLLRRRDRVETRTIEEAFARLKAADESFSRAVFEDFLYALFAEVHAARGSGRIDLLEPYCSEAVRSALLGRTATTVSDIVIGAMRIEGVTVDLERRVVTVTALFTANYTEGGNSYYVEERWKLLRSADARSRAPEKASIIGCPSCGAALEALVASKCRYCNETTSAKEGKSFDWRVDAIDETARELRGPMLTGTTEEVGTDEPTRVAPDVQTRFAELQARDPELTWTAFVRRVELVFAAFHEAWSNQELGGVRPYLSDALFGIQRYWVETYKAQGLRNVTADRSVVSVHLCRVLRDAYFDSMTVRVFAQCLDYTLDAKGDVVGGSKTEPRQFSEYWTFIRSKNKLGAPRTEPGCPNCGAPTDKINMTGKCESCGVKITMGEFDWVLSRIEQDEVFDLEA